MGTLVHFHAHPDDEVIGTGGCSARAAAEGHRVVLVVATDGALGEVPGNLSPGESLVDRRRAETERSAAILGIHRLVWLGYADSGMTGWDQNANGHSFHQAPLDDAAARLAEILRDERADVLTVYDWHGVYGHPDHIKVHQVGVRAAALAGTGAVFESTINRDAVRAMMELIPAPEGREDDFDVDGPADDGNPFGMPEADLTHAVDVAPFVELKRQALACHASQITDTGFFLTMPPEVFAQAFGTEWFIRRGTPAGLQPGWLFDQHS